LPVADKYSLGEKKEKALAVGKTLDERDALIKQDNALSQSNESAWIEVGKKGDVKNSLQEQAMNAYVD
jgi:hypothetical protein